MSPSEIAFLALGIVLGAAIGAAIVEAVRSRPAPRREVRVTISPNSVVPRRSSTLAETAVGGDAPRMPGSPEDAAWFEVPAASYIAATPPARSPAGAAVFDRTRVLSDPATIPSSAVAVPVDRGNGTAPGRLGAAPAPSGSTPGGSSTGGSSPAAPSQPSAPPSTQRPGPGAASGPGRTLPGGAVAVLDPLDERDAPAGVRPRQPSTLAPLVIAPAAVGIAILGGRDGTAAGTTPRAIDPVDQSSTSGPPDAGAAATSADPAADPCAANRVLADERCAVAATAADQARVAAEALRDAQRAYDTLRERVERAQAEGDPRALAAGKDQLHRQFRAATALARSADDTEAAAREWLTQINDLNVRARDALRLADAGSAELRAALPRLERMGVEADAARISAANAEVACREAQSQLAACEEAEVLARRQQEAPDAAAASATLVDDDAGPSGFPGDGAGSFERQVPWTQEATFAGSPVVVRILRGDRGARERLVAALGAGDAEAERAWQTRIAGLVGAITGRAIEDGYLDMPEDDTFWSMFPPREAREIVAALSALGFRFDGAGGFADERVPAQRDLSLAVGYAGLDRMRIRNWPREQELAELYRNADVAADEWLAHNAGDLTLGEMVDALGPRAGNLADVWNAWGRVRPLLLSAD